MVVVHHLEEEVVGLSLVGVGVVVVGVNHLEGAVELKILEEGVAGYRNLPYHNHRCLTFQVELPYPAHQGTCSLGST